MAAITSKELGEEEVEICKDNRSVGPNAIRDGMTFGFQTVTRPIVTASEVMQLPDLSFYLRTPGEYPVAKINLVFDNLQSITPGFIKRKTIKTPQTKYIEAIIAHYQIGNLSQLDDKARKKLMSLQEGTYDNKEREQNEMKEVVSAINNKNSNGICNINEHENNVDDKSQIEIQEMVLNEEVNINL
jgi:type IV secretory pathway TraG/TraD family ATPase VirD4